MVSNCCFSHCFCSNKKSEMEKVKLQDRRKSNLSLADSLPWMERPPLLPTVKSGLEHFSRIDRLVLVQLPEREEHKAEFIRNQYLLMNSAGEQVYSVIEKDIGPVKLSSATHRQFYISVFDETNKEVIRITREFKFTNLFELSWIGGKFQLFSQEVKVETPHGELLGIIKRRQTVWKTCFDVLNSKRQVNAIIEGPMCNSSLTDPATNNPFRLKDLTDKVIGKIGNEFNSLNCDMFNSPNNLCITFPIEMSVRIKAVMLGALFHLNSMYFENNVDQSYGAKYRSE